MPEVGTSADEITDGEQEEKNRQRTEHDLPGHMQAQRANKHHRGEQAPHRKVRRHRSVIGRRVPSQLRQNNERHQRQPEQAVGKKCGGGEGVALPPFHDAGDNLRRAAVANSHGQYHAVEFVEPGVVQVKQDSCHAEAEQPQRRRIPCRNFHLS